MAFREWLATVDVEQLADRERVELVAELERVKGAASAAQARAAFAVAESRATSAPSDAGRSVGSEVALARRESPTSGDRFVGLSRALMTQLPRTLAALAAGKCSERHAMVVARVSSMLSEEHRAELDRRVGPLLGRLGVDQADRAKAGWAPSSMRPRLCTGWRRQSAPGGSRCAGLLTAWGT